ncbi:hypothetical protein [Actinoallomurus sp. CA-142502]|uniref:hypothetical protein n=1 Tax=Actinoallomurus sp. CA-142502 TaxID=3239885 RepID=UPI003D949303
MAAAGARWGRRLGLLALGAVAGIALTASLFAVATWPRSTLVHREDQPSTVRYQDGYEHHLGLYRERTLLHGTSYHLVIGSDPSLSYGHMVDITPTFGGTFAVRTSEWTAAGVRVRFTTGHELFVPASAFIGGR